MATATATKTANGKVGEPESDLAQLWQSAVEEYEKKTKTSLRMSPFKNVEDVMRGTDGMSQKFKEFRHDQGKTDKVRTAFKNNLWLIQKVVNTVQMVGNAAAAFPPAMPASLIFSAFGQVMTTFGQMSADYDKIMGFYDFTHRFLDRLSIIQDRTPDLPPFKRCVVRVFSSMLVICSVAQEYVKEKRMKKWFHTLVDGSDSNLGGAYKDMEAAINELSQAVNLATLRTVDIIAEMVRNMSDDVEFIVTKVTVIDERTHATHSNTNILLKQGEDMATKQDIAISKADKILEANREIRELVEKITEQSRSHDRATEKEKAQLNQKKQKSDPADKERDALNHVKSYLTTNSKWTAVSKDAKIQRREIKNTHVTGTGDWILKDPAYEAWTKEENPILWLRGPAGIGKSFLSYAALTDLETSLKEKKGKFPAYFFFREEISSLTSWDEALCCLAYQIAEQDPKYSELLAAELSKDESNENLWTRLFSARLPDKSESTAFLILDGVDEITDKEEQEKVLASLRQVIDEKLNIQILIACRPDMVVLDSLSLPTLDVTTVNMASDIREVIRAGCKSLPRLRKFRKPVKSAIVKKLRNKADGMRYVEHMLRRLSYIGREKAVLKDLERHLPDNLNALYSLMLNECQKDRTEEQYQALKKLFAWLAYSKRALTLNEASELVALTASESDFDVEDELIGRSARILELARTDEHEDDEVDDRLDEAVDDSMDDVEDDIKDNGSSPLTFQERSLREYFQAIDVDKQGLRTPPSAAHLTIFEMCLDTLLSAKPTRPNYERELNLTDYSANFWVKHFVEIDLDRTSDTDVVRLVQKLRRIFHNENNVARILEYFSGQAYSEMLDSPDSAASIWLDKVKGWVDRASLLECAPLPADAQNWAKDFTILNAMIPLARGHVENWYQEYYGIANVECFRFARDALTLSGVELASQTLETVLAMADYFPDIEKSAGAMRAISAQLSFWQIAPETVMEYTNKGMEMASTNSGGLRFFLARSLSISNARLENIDKAVQLLDDALSYLPENWKDDLDLIAVVECAYSEKARYYEFLNKPEEAVNSYNESRSVNPNTALSGWLLDDITRVYHEERDPKAVQLFQLVKSWSDKERSAWFDYMFEGNDNYAMMRLNQIAGYGGEEEKDFVTVSYDKYISALTPPSNSLFLAKSSLASLYRTVIGDQTKALALLRELIKTNLADYDFSMVVEERFSEVRADLADMLFAEFCSTADPFRKSALLEEIKNIPSRMTAVGGYQVMESNINAILALGFAVMGPLTEYSKIMQGTFDGCMEGLSDSVGWNDSGCFRLLSKVLSFVEGLERDALIAISLQFSRVMEPEVDAEESSEESEAETPDESQSTADDDNANKSEESATSRAEESSVVTKEEGSTTNGTIHLSETTISSTTVEDGTLKESSTILIEEATVESSKPAGDSPGTEATTNGDHSPEEAAEPEPVNEYALPPIEDEDVDEGPAVWCDGECGSEWSTWTEPLHLCLYCANCDLCTPCFNKRMAQNKGEANTNWHSYCGKDHKYLKGPLKGWKGVKDGIMRIEAEDGSLEKIEVKQWLKELKEERWPKAWENFWLQRTGARNVGF